jgi:ankyrin repeat protein/mono/diheme cytochrome c family protein
MWSVDATRARTLSAAMVLIVLATPLLIDTRPTVHGADKPGVKSLPAELAKAIRDGDLNAVSAQLDAGVDVNALDADGNTPLLLAAVYAGPECVELLLKKRADVNAVNKLGVTPLHRAATNYEKAKLLVDAGANVKVTTKSGRTPLTLAARKAGNSKTVKLLLSKGADAKERHARGANPIQVAAACGDLDTLKLLVEAGADVNDFTTVSSRAEAVGVRTPLGWAAYRNDVPMVRYLLECKADPNKATLFGTPLTFAAWSNSALAAEVLLAHGAKVDVKGQWNGSTPLHWAAGNDTTHPEFVKLLLKHGADPNAEFGEQIDRFLGVALTPRLIAEKRGQTAIVEALVAAGAKAPPKPRSAQRSVKPVPEKPDAQLIRDSAESAIRLLQESAVASIESSGRHASRQGGGSCLTCHQHFLPLAAMGQARDRAVRLDRDAVTKLGDQVAPGIPAPLDIAEVDLFLQVTSINYAAFGLIGDHRPASVVTHKWIHQLAMVQAEDGRWPAFVPRPPIQGNDVSTTALAIQTIQHYGWAGRKAEFDTAVDRARKWLWTVKAETTEDAAYQLLGLHWAGEPADKLADLAKALLNQQRKDGGWAQLPKLESDAYATGQALYALSRAAKHPTTNRDWQNGLRFLLGTQYDDGSWHVISRAYPFQPTMDSGFPHGRDSWISAAGTSWAVLAMTEALPPGTTTEKPPSVATKSKDAPPVAAEKVDFAKQIKPLLERSCVACHGPEKQRSNFRLDSREALLKGGNTGTAAVVPGKSAQSVLLDYISGRVEGMEMPPLPKRDKFAALSNEELALLRAWINQGAEWPNEIVITSPTIEESRK